MDASHVARPLLSLLLVFGAGLAAGCKSPPASPPAPATAPAPASAAPAAPTAAAPDKTARKLYGAALAPAEPIALSQLLASPEKWKSGPVTVEGHVRKACTRKGCWMELAGSEDKAAPGARVTFKDYGFFVPTDSAGTKARVQGVVEVDTLSAAAVRHYEEEGAVFAGKKPDGTAPEVRLVASGVELWR